MNSISILGCGWLGKSLAHQFIDNDYKVIGSTRSETKKRHLEEEGINATIIDIDTVRRFDASFFDVAHLIISTTNKNISSHKRLISFLEEKHPLLNLFFISSTSVYSHSSEEIDEYSPLIESKLSSIEKVYQNTTLNTTILRLGGIIGEGRHPGTFFKHKQVLKNPEAEINLIHENDIFSVILSLIQKGFTNEVFNLVSDEHPKKMIFYSKAFKAFHKKNASFIPMEQESVHKMISNQKIKSSSGIVLKLSNYYSFI